MNQNLKFIRGLNISAEKQIGGRTSPIYDVDVIGNGVTVKVRVKAHCSCFEVVWTSRKISDDAKYTIEYSMAHRFWG